MNETKLTNARLIEALETVKNNPIEEKELSEMLMSKESQLSKVANNVLQRIDKDDTIDNYDLKEASIFVGKIKFRVLSPRDEEGYIKNTEATKNKAYPNFSEAEKILNIITKKSKGAEEKLDKIIWKIAKINKEDLTPWEQNLVREDIIEFITNPMMTAMGLDSSK